MLNREISAIEKLGVDIKLNSRVTDIDSLFAQGFKAVFLAVGAHVGERMRVPGEDVKGVYDAVEFLRNVNLGREMEVGKKVAVIGGGNTATDSARVALRMGATQVHMFYRREKKDMPAIEEEILAVEEEGIHIHELTAPTRVLSQEGKVTGLELIRMELGEFDKSGRKTPRQIKGSEYSVVCDTVIQAIGQRPDTGFIEKYGMKIGMGRTIAADPRTLATDRPGVFAGGDAVTGPWTVIEAIAGGQRAASSIKRYLQGKELGPRVDRQDQETFLIPHPEDVEDIKERSRVTISELHPGKRTSSFKEVNMGYTAQEAMSEASRCLRCDAEAGGD
jgi:NADH-quinone oxidoreductase subunit F